MSWLLCGCLFNVQQRFFFPEMIVSVAFSALFVGGALLLKEYIYKVIYMRNFYKRCFVSVMNGLFVSTICAFARGQ